MNLLLLLAVIVGTSNAQRLPSQTPSSSSQSPPELRRLFSDYWEFLMNENPLLASGIKATEDNAKHWGSHTMENFMKVHEKVDQLLRRAEKIKKMNLRPADALNLKIFMHAQQTYLDNFRFLKYYNPVNFLSGPQRGLPDHVKTFARLEKKQDFEDLLLLYGDFPRYMDELTELMRSTIREHTTPSHHAVVKVAGQIEKLIDSVTNTKFYKPFVNLTEDFLPEEAKSIRERAQDSIGRNVLRPYRKMQLFLTDEYVPAARSEIAASSLSGGSEYYAALIKFHTSTNKSPAQIHDIGLSEVNRLKQEARETARKIGLGEKTFAQVAHALRNDPKQQFKDKDDILRSYKHVMYEKIPQVVDQVLLKIPKENVTLVERNDPTEILAGYQSGTVDGSRLGAFLLNVAVIDALFRYEITTLSLHEAVPGHHTQFTYMKEDKNAPLFRRFVSYGLNDAPSRYPINTAYVEGWGLYCEYLGEELGLYKDPYQKMGYYSYNMLRAARLVVDTGMHALGWSRNRAVEFLVDNTALSNHDIEVEIDRYITWPGQALAYKIGELHIKELRKNATEALGDKFDLRKFHDVILLCGGPLEILTECVEQYVNKTKTFDRYEAGYDDFNEGRYGDYDSFDNEIYDTADASSISLSLLFLAIAAWVTAAIL